VQVHNRQIKSRLNGRSEKLYGLVRDYLNGVRDSMREIWGVNDKFMFTKDVTLKALIRVLGDVMKQRKLMDGWSNGESASFAKLTKVWASEAARFRNEGFYERFPAKGQVERVRRIHLELTRALGLEPPEPDTDE
jgi:hypothetical protein